MVCLLQAALVAAADGDVTAALDGLGALAAEMDRFKAAQAEIKANRLRKDAAVVKTIELNAEELVSLPNVIRGTYTAFRWLRTMCFLVRVACGEAA